MQTNRSDGQRHGEKGQTEPLAALVAVIVICLAVSVYTGYLTGVFSSLGADRDVSDGTADRLWDEISNSGVFDSQETTIEESVGPAILPQGRYVYVTVTFVETDGRLVTEQRAAFGPQGEPTTVDPPESANSFERAIPIKHRRGDIRPGTLEVLVWE